MIDLNTTTLADLHPPVERFHYDRGAVSPGVVHLSVGNFHRAHQAWYFDRLLGSPGHESWGICGVGLIDDETERLKLDAFPAQDDLYILTQYAPDGAVTHRVIGSIVGYLFAPDDPEAVLARMAAPETRLVSMTITEGGYNQDAATGSYRLDAPLTRVELAEPSRPRSAFGFIVEALRRRRDAGIAPFTVLSCDNLRGNGAVARRAVLAHAAALDADLARWIEAHATFPSCMVDRITPAVLKEDAERVNAECGVNERLPVICETFAQWVIEDHFCNGRPPLEEVGVQFVADVHPFETAKTRMLNAGHSVLGYPGQLAGLETVKEAIDHPLIHRLVHDVITHDAIPVLEPPPGIDLAAYRDSIIARFGNPHVGDRLPRITGDGASKLPTFLLPTLALQLERGGETGRLAFVVACFLRYLGGRDDLGRDFTPQEPHLTAEQIALARDPARALLSLPVFADLRLTADSPFVAATVACVQALEQRGTLAVLDDVLSGIGRAEREEK